MKLVFPNKKAKHSDVLAFLHEKFPRLRDGGGFEVLRAQGGGGGCKPLHLVPPGKDSYSLAYIKERFPQAMVYLRPLQSNLDESLMSYKDVNGGHPPIDCLVCGRTLSYTDFRTHQAECNERNSGEDLFDSTPHGAEQSVHKQIESDRKLAERLSVEEDEGDRDKVIEVSEQPQCTSLVSALKKLSLKTQPNGENEILLFVQRRCVLKNALEDLSSKPMVTSKVSVEFVGEPAIDTGGPTKEMFSIAFQQAITFKLTRGSLPNITFMHDQNALVDGSYKSFGRLVALSLPNGAEGPHMFSPSLAYFILGIRESLPVDHIIKEIPDDQFELVAKLKRLKGCVTPSDWASVFAEFDDRFDMGINRAFIPIEEKDDVIRAAVKHVVISSVLEEIYSFMEGLSSYGVLPVLMQYPEEAYKELTYLELSVEHVGRPFIPLFSAKGSSKRINEELIVYNFHQFLQKCAKGMITRTILDLNGIMGAEQIEEQVSKTLGLHDVLQFITGARFLPPGGIEGSLEFNHEALSRARCRSNTCANSLCFPVNGRYAADISSTFASNFADDIFEGPGFGHV